MSTQIPELAGIHHVKLPVTDLERSWVWYQSRLGFEQAMEFSDGVEVIGLLLRHPRGGPDLGLWLDPDRAAAAAGFDYFVFGAPNRQALEALAERLTALGERHPGVHPGTAGWVLPHVKDPDGHELRFQCQE
ncbi:VOC family protein [Paeniglutamicibacter gangotriensis]|uniref:VOC family protein n=1 Tax=Paeniglutamicibacter gangotriensis TaxID=254787 RepID=UPI0037CA7F3D